MSVHFRSGLLSPCYASQGPLPDATQDSVRGCRLGFTAVALSGDMVSCAFKAQPAQNRTCSFPAYGSHLGCLTAGLAAFRTRSGACDTLSRRCVRYVRYRFAFSLASALRSTTSAAGRPALFGGFIATTAESDFSCRTSSASVPHLPDADQSALQPVAGHEISQVPTRSFRT